MGTVRKRYSAAFKAQVALEACKGQKTLSELASEFGVHELLPTVKTTDTPCISGAS
jgi:transposase-like protein